MMVRHFRHSRLHVLFLVLLFFSISGYCRGATKGLPSSWTQNASRLYSLESQWVLADLDGDRTPDLALGERLGRSKDAYFYRVQLQLSSDTPSTSFTVVHDDALGLKITGLDIDGDDDIDLIISDRFSHQHIGIWLNDGKGHFVKSLPGRFSPNPDSDLAFVAVDLDWSWQPSVDKQQRRLLNYLPTTGYIQPLRFKRAALNQHDVEWLFRFAAISLQQRAPPTYSAV